MVFAIAAMSSTTTTYLWVDWTLNWGVQNASQLTGARNQTISALLVLWICNTGRYINHFVNHHRWWIGESWRNIYVGCKNWFPVGGFQGFMETLVKKSEVLNENDQSRNSVCPFIMYSFRNTFLNQAEKMKLNSSTEEHNGYYSFIWLQHSRMVVAVKSTTAL